VDADEVGSQLSGRRRRRRRRSGRPSPPDQPQTPAQMSLQRPPPQPTTSADMVDYNVFYNKISNNLNSIFCFFCFMG